MTVFYNETVGTQALDARVGPTHRGLMTFSDHMTRAPLALDDNTQTELADALARLPVAMQQMVEATASCSPYLRSLLIKHNDLPKRLERMGADALSSEILDEIETFEFAALKPGLRRIKGQIALLAGLADLSGVWSLETVTQTLTELADRALDHALKLLVLREIERGKLPGLNEKDAGTAGGMVILAMGKMGAGELNYSSDIDLICLFDETRFEPDDYSEARTAFIRVTRALAATMSEVTGDGYVFRTDLRLRPDASVTPVCIAMEAAERYYESVGRTWERAAFIKARACAGDIEAGRQFLKRLRPFVWRKHLDFAAIQDAHDMRLRIRDHKGLGGEMVLEGHNMKLGAGGIREIEFFTQTQQLIAGGRDADLRVRGTIEGLEQLAQAGWITDELARTLTEHYRAHREIEHRLQMIGDAQTHDLPNSPEDFDRLARFCGQSNTDAFRETLRERLTNVAVLTEEFFAPDAEEIEDDSEAKSYLDRWQSFPALRSERAVVSFNRLFPPMLVRLQSAADPNGAINTFEQFLRGLPAGVQVFSLFEANPQLGELIVDICTASPALASYLGRNASVLDAVIGGDFFTKWPETATLGAELAGQIADKPDFESKLDTARRWQKEWHFRVGVHHLQGLIAPEEAGHQYAALAEACVAALLPVVTDQISVRHGKAPGRGAVVLGMGSLGAGRLTAHSDLDLIVVYDASSGDSSDGARPLPIRSYFARFTQTLVTALSAPTAEGRLYEVDMRLRPSGQSGPVATSLQAFSSYQMEQAWVWEHLALTRARVLAGDGGLSAEVDTVCRAAMNKPREPGIILGETQEMRTRLAELGNSSIWDVKAGPGGAQDIDLFAQAACLADGAKAKDLRGWMEAAVRLGWCSTVEAERLITTRRLFWRVSQASRLISDKPFAPETVGTGGVKIMLRDTGEETLDDLTSTLTNCRREAKDVIDRAMA
ncbi:MAG: glutamine-synthetase adenylyltransferase [Litoreibacter sp.]